MFRAKKILQNVQFTHDYDYYKLRGPLVDVIKYLEDLNKEAKKKGYTNIRIEWQGVYSSDDIRWYIVGDRLELDSEYEERIELEKQVAEQRKKGKLNKEQKERKEYERLKKKFERKV